jgi:hypothetical protein
MAWSRERMSVGSRRASPRARLPQRVFLLSPANCNGKRAQLLFREDAAFDLARRVRSSAGAPLGEVFSFVSGLYFRGKLTYASSFASTLDHARIITPGDGLERTGTAVRLDDLARYAAVSIDAGESRYRLPLVRDCRRLARGLSPDDEVVLLGSIATPKYLAILEPIFGDRLRVPRDFIGRGDMSRGALLLRAVRAASELEYISARALRAGPADPLP